MTEPKPTEDPCIRLRRRLLHDVKGCTAQCATEPCDFHAMLHLLEAFQTLSTDAQEAAWEAAAPKKLRTRGEVDAEIVQVVRDCYRTGNLAWLGEDLTGLCRELTLPEPERCPQCLCVGHHQKPCNPKRPPVGAGLAVCPCDASQRLHGYLRDILELYDSEGRSWGQVAGVLGRWRGGHP